MTLDLSKYEEYKPPSLVGFYCKLWSPHPDDLLISIHVFYLVKG